MESTWTDIDSYFEDLYVGHDEALEYTLRNSREKGLPEISVSPCQGRMLQILAVMSGARRVLEVGTLGGYSTTWLARAVGPAGRGVTIEANALHAEVASENLRHAGVNEVVTQLQGDAREVLSTLVEEGSEPFDLVFLDADKEANPVYLGYALKLSRPGTVIIGDNVVRGGKVLDDSSDDPAVTGTRQFCSDQAADERLLATAVQTVGVKGHDGFTLSVVK